MSQLARLQADFWVAAFGDGAAAARAAAASIAPTPARSPARSARIYGDTGHARDLHELEAAYPLLARGLGAASFLELCRAFIVDIGGRRSALARLGGELPAFLERAGRPAAWVDLAALEDMRAQVLVAPDCAAAPAAALAAAGAAAATARLVFVPALCRRTCTSDMARLAREPAALADAAASGLSPAELVVWRAGLDIAHTRLVGPAALALAQAMAGATVEVVLSAFAACDDPMAAALAALSAWFADGWVARVA